MQHEITKLCADSLRAFTLKNHGVQLRSSHAHELVAAYFGYASRAALLADISHPISAIRGVQYFILSPTAPIEKRWRELEGLPASLPDDLGEGVYLPIIDEGWLPKLIWPTYETLAKFLADESLKQQPRYFNDQAVQREGIKVEPITNGIRLRVSREYVSSYLLLEGLPGTKGRVDIFELRRVAGHIGYQDGEHYVSEADSIREAIEMIDNAMVGI